MRPCVDLLPAEQVIRTGVTWCIAAHHHLIALLTVKRIVVRQIECLAHGLIDVEQVIRLDVRHEDALLPIIKLLPFKDDWILHASATAPALLLLIVQAIGEQHQKLIEILCLRRPHL